MPLQPNAKTPRNLRILHTQVGSWPKGQIISENDLPHPSDPRDAGLTQEARDKEHNDNVQRLINLGAVEVVVDPKPDDKTNPIEPGPDLINQMQNATNQVNADGLDDLHVADLKEKAKDAGIAGSASMNKAELIDALRAVPKK